MGLLRKIILLQGLLESLKLSAIGGGRQSFVKPAEGRRQRRRGVFGTRKGFGNGFRGQTFFFEAQQRIVLKVFSRLIFVTLWNVVAKGLGKLFEAFWASLPGAKVVISLRTSFKNRVLHRINFRTLFQVLWGGF